MSSLGQWRSSLSPETIFSRPGTPAYPFYSAAGQLFWLESLTDDKGRLAIVTGSADTALRIVTPGDYQVRSAVHEYGGKAFCVHQDVVYFNHYADGALYAQALPTSAQLKAQQMPAPRALNTPNEADVGFADICVSQDGSVLIAVAEQTSSGENINSIVALRLEPAGNSTPQAAQILISGADFYACPVISSDGKKIAWIQWNHPHMPWDCTTAHIADLTPHRNALRIENVQQLAGGEGVSVCQLGFLRDGALVYAQDSDERVEVADNFWNLYRWQAGRTHPLTGDKAEYGDAHWVFGQCRWLQMADNSLLAIRTNAGKDELVEINIDTKEVVIQLSAARISHLQVSPCHPKACFVVQYADQEAALVEIDTSAANAPSEVKSLRQAPPLLPRAAVSPAQMHKFDTVDGIGAYAHFYPPHNPDYPHQGEQNAPAIVMVHGGPSSRADQSFNPLVQYFTSSGFAVIDVNHRGSTGLGRAYRQHLLGLWGEVDASDIRDAVAHFVNSGQVDPNKVCIRGGSAGGFAVLRALTQYPDLFCAGACYYGIGNLITLSEITHKFESHYTDQLIGEVFDPTTAMQADSRYQTRSPIFAIDKIKSPVILFQGLDDKVVPPAVSREVVKVLKDNAVKHRYIEYTGEGHGFRQAQTRIDALNQEMAFYQQALGRS